VTTEAILINGFHTFIFEINVIIYQVGNKANWRFGVAKDRDRVGGGL